MENKEMDIFYDRGDHLVLKTEEQEEPQIEEVIGVKTLKSGIIKYKIGKRWVRHADLAPQVEARLTREQALLFLKKGYEDRAKQENENCFGVAQPLTQAIKGGLVASQAFSSAWFGEIKLTAVTKGEHKGRIRALVELFVLKMDPGER